MEYVPYVTQCRPENIKALLDAARMAELTTPAPGQTDTVVSTQLAEVRDEIREMNKQEALLLQRLQRVDRAQYIHL